MTPLPEKVKELVDGPNFVTFGTTGPDGTPQLTVHWIARDGDDLLLSTVRGRKKELNLRANKRVSVMMIDPADPYAYFEVRGTATVTEDGGRELIDDLHEKYRGARPYPWDPPEAVRVVVRVPPEHVVTRGL